jgi:hypothetical protein
VGGIIQESRAALFRYTRATSSESATIGYEKFENILSGTALWLEVFRDSIVDIDFDAINPNDFRAKPIARFGSSRRSIDGQYRG